MHCRVKHEWCQTLAQLRSRFVFPLERTNDRVWFAESHGLSEWIWVVGHGKQTAKCKSNMRQGWSLYPWKHDWQLSYAANHRWHWWGGERTKCSPDAVWWKGCCAWKTWSHFRGGGGGGAAQDSCFSSTEWPSLNKPADSCSLPGERWPLGCLFVVIATEWCNNCSWK